jgi:hypothetical protein
MKKRGLASPDPADALALTFAHPVAAHDHLLQLTGKPRHQHQYDPFQHAWTGRLCASGTNRANHTNFRNSAASREAALLVFRVHVSKAARIAGNNASNSAMLDGPWHRR